MFPVREVGARLIFIAEGYGASERSKFEADVERLVFEVFEDGGAPLHAVRTLVAFDTVWAASAKSGVPRLRQGLASQEDSKTAFGLFRDVRAPLRIVEPSPWSYDAARKACAETIDANACQRGGASTLILLANDPYYGGLGDDVLIATSSRTSGALSLRHELGHTLGDVGEEYDSGGDYSGANFATAAAPCAVGAEPRRFRVVVDGVAMIRDEWDCASWLPPPATPRNQSGGLRGGGAVDRPPRETEATELVLAEWPWRSLDRGRDFSRRFETALPYVSLDVSVAGALAVDVFVDGTLAKMEFATPETYDRRFAHANVHLNKSTHHEIVIAQRRVGNATLPAAAAAWTPQRLLCHVQIHSSSADTEKLAEPGPSSELGAFATFSGQGIFAGYRPTRDGCLMRDVTKKCFCAVCRNAIVRAVLAKSKGLLGGEAISVTPNGLSIPRLVDHPRLSLRWFRVRGTPAGEKRGEAVGKRMQRHWEAGAGDAGCWEVVATLQSDALLGPLSVLETTARAAVGPGHPDCWRLPSERWRAFDPAFDAAFALPGPAPRNPARHLHSRADVAQITAAAVLVVILLRRLPRFARDKEK
ncbi:hypothetical protein M885DRAFT_521308 [Pelagophyceae sp. CCMP2097]|nr:hypothetical protein M885DRAFT_521308 [Pelagophyceae sp. CCMP2097]